MGDEHKSRNDPMSISVHLKNALTEEHANYLMTSASIRKCSVSRLIRALVRTMRIR